MQIKKHGRVWIVQVWVLCIVSVSILFSGFTFNAWHVAGDNTFDRFQRDTESLIIGRLVKSRQDGIFSAGGLTGADIDHSVHDTWITPKEIDRQYLAYFDDKPSGQFSPYLSQIGGQGMMYGILDRLVRISSARTKYEIFQIIASVVSAFVFTFVILWFTVEFGLTSGILVLVSVVLSQWLTLFGKNLWWSLWAFYVPMVAVMFYLRFKRTNLDPVRLGIVTGAVVFVKCFFNGYEYITTTLVMMTVPFVYYSILDRADIRRFVKSSLAIVIGAMAAILISVIVLVLQIGAAEGNTLGGIEHLTSTFEKRTYGNTGDFNSEFSASLKADTLGVVRNYIIGSYLYLHSNDDGSNSPEADSVIEIRYSHLIFSFAVMSLIVLFPWKRTEPPEERRRDFALVTATWFSILAPLSWFVIFKSHSYIHTHVNFVVWQMPFTLFGFAVWGAVARRAFQVFFKHRAG